MKASIKFRDEQKPVMRAKVPIKMMSLPFQSGVVIGESKEMSLNLSTCFDSGPCFKLSYKPNDSQNPFSVVCKTGIGHFGSPNSSPFVMSAECNLIGNQNPRFFVHFKPQLGDFSAKKSCTSVELATAAKGVPPPVEVVKGAGFIDNGFFGNGKAGVFPVDSVAAETAVAAVGNVFSGIKMSARTFLPVGKRVAVNLRWGVRVPPEGMGVAGDMVMVGKGGDQTSGFSFNKIPFPYLVVDKIGIEHVVGSDLKGAKPVTSGNTDMSEVCLDMKKQLQVIQAENGLLRKSLDDLRSDIAAGKMNFSFGGGGGGRGGGSDMSKYPGGKVREGDLNEELKKNAIGA